MGMAYVFPGQGSQHPGMVSDVLKREKDSRLVFDIASDIAGADILRLCDNADHDLIKRTDYCQICVAAVSLAWLQLLRREGFRAEAVAGHSLGEYCAACAAGCFEVEEALRLIWARGQAMLECALSSPGSMLAIVGMSMEETFRLVRDLSDDYFIHLANHNSLTQTVVAGEEKGLEVLEKKVRRGGARSVRLKVKGAFHTPAFTRAKEAVEERLGNMVIKDPSITFFSGYGGTEVRDAAEVAHSLASGIDSPVLWWEVQRRLMEIGSDPQVEVGPGKVLCNMAIRDYPNLRVCHASDLVGSTG